LLAALFLLPIMANILLINMFILVNDFGPYFNSVIICASLLIILWQQRADLLTLFWVTQKTEPLASSRTHWWIRTLIVVVVSATMISGAILKHYVKR
jgi:undecaprenyl pyrophosphate phosphatase UppP